MKFELLQCFLIWKDEIRRYQVFLSVVYFIFILCTVPCHTVSIFAKYGMSLSSPIPRPLRLCPMIQSGPYNSFQSWINEYLIYRYLIIKQVALPWQWWAGTRIIIPIATKHDRPYCSVLICHYRRHMGGLVQERRNSIALAMELRLSCTNPLICKCHIELGRHRKYFLIILMPVIPFRCHFSVIITKATLAFSNILADIV